MPPGINSRISVALCTYNGERFLREQLESIRLQSRKPDELVICDDRSDDATPEILRDFAADAPFPVCLFTNDVRLGSTKNFERCISHCTGTLIALSDQDDVWREPKLERLEQEFEKTQGIGYVFSDAELINEVGAPLGQTLWDGNYFKASLLAGFPFDMQISALLKCNMVTGTCMMFAADLRSAFLPISKYWIQDYWIATVASCVGRNGVSVPEPLVKYRLHANQQVGANNSISARLRRSWNMPESQFVDRVRGYEDLAIQLKPLVNSTVFESLEGKLTHLRNRAELRGRASLSKITTIVREMSSGRYSRFSNSWQSVVQDLCF